MNTNQIRLINVQPVARKSFVAVAVTIENETTIYEVVSSALDKAALANVGDLILTYKEYRSLAMQQGDIDLLFPAEPLDSHIHITGSSDRINVINIGHADNITIN